MTVDVETFGEPPENYRSPLSCQEGCIALISVLIQKLGGTVDISQEDYNKIAYLRLFEHVYDDFVRFELDPQESQDAKLQ